MDPHARLRLAVRRSLAALLVSVMLACEEKVNGPDLTPVTSGTVSGIPFTVSGGTIYQFDEDGPLFADETGGQIVFDGDPATLGMSDPDLLHVRTYFAVSRGGSLQIAAFGDPGSAVATGVSVGLGRATDVGFVYELRIGGALLADSAFATQPPVLSAEQWVVAELYADSVPGSPAGEAGAALWPLNDLTPSPSEDVLGCGLEPATDASPRAGEAVGYALRDAWLLEVEIVDQVVGPCS